MMASKKDTKNKMATGKESFYGKPTNNFFLISPLNRPTLLQLPYQQHYKCTPPPLHYLPKALVYSEKTCYSLL